MKTIIHTKARTGTNKTSFTNPVFGYYDEIKNYYSVAGPDYAAWSKKFNMHFGYCSSFTGIFNLENMLDNMNSIVAGHLHINKHECCSIADLGCGMGTTARYIAGKFPDAKVTGVSIVDYQVEQGSLFTRQAGLAERVLHVKENFEDLSFADESFEYAYALESACHAGGHDKELFIHELARILKQGGRFVIADGFLKKESDQLPMMAKKIYKKLIACWALPGFATIADFTRTLNQYGLEAQVKEISWRIAPSVMHVPRVVLQFLWNELKQHKTLRMKKERWNNVMGPLLGMLFGLYRNCFGYYIISGKKIKS